MSYSEIPKRFVNQKMKNLTDKEREYLEKNEAKRTKCEVWSRVMGYHRPVQFFNEGKQSEYKERKLFRESIAVSAKEMEAIE